MHWGCDQHSDASCKEDGTKNAPQPEYGNAGAEVRSKNSARHGADKQAEHQLGIDVAQPEVEQASYACENHGVHDVGTDHHLRLVAVKQE